MVKTIRLFIAVICNFALALTATVAYAQNPASMNSSSYDARGALESPERMSERGQGGGKVKAPACSLCQVEGIDPCKLKKIVDANSGKKIEKFWVIDARPGIISPCGDKDTYYVSSPRTRVFIINMNPFAFDYEITKVEENVPETAQITFLKLLGTPISDAIGGAGGTGASASASGARLTDATCATDIANAEAYLNKGFALDEKSGAKSFDAWMTILNTEFKGHQDTYVELRKAYISLLDRWATCEELCVSMDSYQDKYKLLPDKYNFGNLAFKALQINNRLVSDFKAKFPKIEECPDFAGSNLQTKLSSMRRQVEVLLDKLTVLCNNVFKADNRAKLAAMYEAIDTVRAHPEILLIHTFDVGGYSNPTRVKVSVEPKNKELKETFPQVIGDGPQPCDEAGGGQARQQQSGKGSTPEQPVVSATPKPSPTAP